MAVPSLSDSKVAQMQLLCQVAPTGTGIWVPEGLELGSTWVVVAATSATELGHSWQLPMTLGELE